MSGDCDICGDYGHVEESCPNIEEALKLERQDRARIKKEYSQLGEELARVESRIDWFVELLHKRRLTQRAVNDN